MYYNISRSDTFPHVSMGKFHVIHRLTPIRISFSAFEPSARILSTTLTAHRFIVASESINIAE